MRLVRNNFMEALRALWRLACAALVVVGCLTATEAASSQFTEPTFRLAEHPVTDIFFLDADRGWVACGGDDRGYLFRTQDGGRSWERADVNHRLYDLFFIDKAVGWGLSFEVKGESSINSQLFGTLDGGRTWNLLSSFGGSPRSVTDFLFTDRTNGWFLAEGETGDWMLFRTTDGGRTFSQTLLFRAEESATASHILRDRDGSLWIFGKNTILRSSDQGTTWDEQLDKSQLPGGRRELLLRSGWVFGYGRGFAVGQGHGGILLRTEGGKRWEIALQAKKANFFEDIAFADELHGCIVGASTLLYCTTDGGVSWVGRDVLPPSPYKENRFMKNLYQRVAFASTRRGLVVSAGGFLYQTEDMGKSWQQLDLVKVANHGSSRK